MRISSYTNIHLGIFFSLASSRFGDLSAQCMDNEPHRKGLEVRQAPAITSTERFLRRGNHASAVAGHFLYIDGGSFSFINNGSTVYEYSSTMLAIDLSQDWTNTSVTLRSIIKPSGAPILDFGSLWYAELEDVLYTGFAGVPSIFNSDPSLPATSIWTFKPDGAGSGTWTQALNASEATLRSISQSVGAFMAYGPNSAWTLGGHAANENPYVLGPSKSGVREFDFRSKTFTDTDILGPNSNGIAEFGVMQYVPSFGTAGIVIVMGGRSPTDKGLIGFDTVQIYDPAKQEWFKQTTTGDAPAKRFQPCAAGISSTNDTYEIFVYAGWGGRLGKTTLQYDTISILTLPAFHWISVLYNPKHPRHAHTCNAVGGSQIVTVGGVDSNSKVSTANDIVIDLNKSTFNSTADPFKQGLAIFDMTALAWADKYTANAPRYVQSDILQAFYAESQGGYTQQLTAGVATLMAVKPLTNSSTSNPSSSSNSSSSSNPNSSSNSGSSSTPTPKPAPRTSHASEIAGGVGGGVGLLLLGIAFLFLKKLQNRKATGHETRRFVHKMFHNHDRLGERPAELDDRGVLEMGKAEPHYGGPMESGGGQVHEMEARGPS